MKNKRNTLKFVFLALFLVFTPPIFADSDALLDPYLWLEEIDSKAAHEWVEQQNARSLKFIEEETDYRLILDRLIEINNSKERIAYPLQQGKYLYNFWKDEEHLRGVWRRTTLAEFRNNNTAWEIVLDLDALAAKEGENWVWIGADCLYPEYKRCLLWLSRGGADAAIIREFDTVDKTFVEGGFVVPEAKSRVEWQDADTVYVATDFGAGTLTSAGYPRVIKEWKRNTPLTQAKLVYEGQLTDVSATPFVVRDHNHVYEVLSRNISFYRSENLIRRGDKLVKLDLPLNAGLGFFQDQLIVELKSDWKLARQTYPQGALLAISLDRFLNGRRDFVTLYRPGARRSLSSYAITRDAIILNELNNVKSRLYEVMLHRRRTIVLSGRKERSTGSNRDKTRSYADRWTRKAVDLPTTGNLTLTSTDIDSDEYFVTFADFLTPHSLYLTKTSASKPEKLKGLPHLFDSSGLVVRQFDAVSKDGTSVPYFVVGPNKLDARTPVLLYAYGGFELAMLPGYSVNLGAGWFTRGGIYVLANIRGGGEFGPHWHQAARKENKHKSIEDLIAVAEDLIARGITSAPSLGLMGGSNGGLLVGAAMTQRPDLFGAVVSQVPLFDMKRYTKLLAGSSWIDEYGDPDKPDEWAYIRQYSPYQNVLAEKTYPPLFVTTSTRDDRVHPGHARKMVAKMLAQGHNVLYFENTDGGHAGAANNQQQVKMWALSFAFLQKMLAESR